MDCRSVREFADAFIAEQLLVETTQQVVRHLETCEECRTEFATRRLLRDRLRTAFGRAVELEPRPDFAAQLAASLRPPQNLSRRSVLRSWWALAAGVAVAAGGGEFLREARSRSRLTALARQAAGDHQNCAVKFNLAERPISLGVAARRYGGPYAALASFVPPPVGSSIEVAERHSCVYDGVRFGHIVLRDQGALVSLLVTKGAGPAAPQLESADREYAIASLRAAGFVAFVVGSMDAARVLRLAQAFADPLSRQLA
jgi:anti-sigma factor RsiW